MIASGTSIPRETVRSASKTKQINLLGLEVRCFALRAVLTFAVLHVMAATVVAAMVKTVQVVNTVVHQQSLQRDSIGVMTVRVGQMGPNRTTVAIVVAHAV